MNVMTDRERAAALADKAELLSASGHDIWVKVADASIFVAALRAYAAPAVSADLRETIARAITPGFMVMPEQNADAALAAISAAGYVIVPREPTEAMIEAAAASHIMISRGMAYDALRAALATGAGHEA